MSRIVKQDFQELKNYIEKFNLKNILLERKYIELLSVFHKKYFSFFVLISELEDSLQEKEYLYLKEANSDLITCLFHATTGNYKSAKLILRSSIECFLKGFSLSWDSNIDKEKSVFELFDKIKKINYFSIDPFKSKLKDINDVYKNLCRDVHTAERINMANINSLDFFPKYSQQNSKIITSIILKIAPIFCFLLCDKYNKTYHKLHHTSKEIILNSIEKKDRRKIMNIE